MRGAQTGEAPSATRLLSQTARCHIGAGCCASCSRSRRSNRRRRRGREIDRSSLRAGEREGEAAAGFYPLSTFVFSEVSIRGGSPHAGGVLYRIWGLL